MLYSYIYYVIQHIKFQNNIDLHAITTSHFSTPLCLATSHVYKCKLTDVYQFWGSKAIEFWCVLQIVVWEKKECFSHHYPTTMAGTNPLAAVWMRAHWALATLTWANCNTIVVPAIRPPTLLAPLSQSSWLYSLPPWQGANTRRNLQALVLSQPSISSRWSHLRASPEPSVITPALFPPNARPIDVQMSACQVYYLWQHFAIW